MSRTSVRTPSITYRTRADPLLIPPGTAFYKSVTFRIRSITLSKALASIKRNSGIEVRLPYHGGPLGAHMHDPSATRPGEVDTMTGKWSAGSTGPQTT